MVYLFLADGFEEVEALTPVDVLRRAGCSVCTVSVMTDRKVVGAHRICVEADAHFDACDFSDAEMLILPGGMPGTTNLRSYAPLCDLLLKADSEGLSLAAICAAPSILGELGLLKGRQATCYPGFEDRLIGAKYSKKSVVRDGRILTAVGMGVALAFSLAATEMLTDKKTADGIAASVQSL